MSLYSSYSSKSRGGRAAGASLFNKASAVVVGVAAGLLLGWVILVRALHIWAWLLATHHAGCMPVQHCSLQQHAGIVRHRMLVP